MDLLPVFSLFLEMLAWIIQNHLQNPHFPMYQPKYSRSLWWHLIVCLMCIFGEGNGNPFQYSCLENPMGGGAWWAAVHGVAKSQTQLNDFPFTFHFHALEKDMATHSSVLAWRIPGTGEPGGLPSMGLHRVRHDWSDLAAAVCIWASWWLRQSRIYLQCRRPRFVPWVGKISWRRKW